MAIVREQSGNGGFVGPASIAPDQHNSHGQDPTNRTYAVTPSDTVDLPNGITEAVYCGAAGLLAVIYPGGQQDIVGVAAGRNPLRVRRILATGTTATGISAAY